MIKENIVSIIKGNTKYPILPYNPNKIYGEFSDFNKINLELDENNSVYEMVRDCFIKLELDKTNIGTKAWNPLGELVSKGENVVIKPNLVYHNHPLGEEGILSMISNASIIRPIIDYILLATDGDVKITICDVPLQSANWEEIIKYSGLEELVNFYKKNSVNISLLDLRLEISTQNKEGIIIDRKKKERDPLGYTAVNIGENSSLMPIIDYSDKFEITDYGSGTVGKHHNIEVNEYLLPNTILNSDLFINIPKFKTHRKAGITFGLKNIIGINGDKSWLAHHRKGGKNEGGDEYDKFTINSWLRTNMIGYLKQSKLGIVITKVLYRVYRIIVLKGVEPKKVYMEGNNKPITEGSWYGNDTIWRCIKDLNNIIFFTDKNGILQKNKQRKYLLVGDGIMGGDKEGPMEQTPKYPGIIIGGFNPVYTDSVAAKIMGFDYKKIPQIKECFNNNYYILCNNTFEEIIWKSNLKDIKKLNLKFIPSVNWKKHLQ